MILDKVPWKNLLKKACFFWNRSLNHKIIFFLLKWPKFRLITVSPFPLQPLRRPTTGGHSGSPLQLFPKRSSKSVNISPGITLSSSSRVLRHWLSPHTVTLHCWSVEWSVDQRTINLYLAGALLLRGINGHSRAKMVRVLGHGQCLGDDTIYFFSLLYFLLLLSLNSLPLDLS